MLCYNMFTMELELKSEIKTKEIAKKLSKYLKEGDIVCLCGPLGSGKTTFTQGILQGLEFSGYVHSPSFIIANKYPAKIPVVHLDLYRFKNIDDMENIGIYEYLYSKEEIVIIEWAEKIKELLPDEHILINFKIIDENRRALSFSAKGKQLQNIIDKLTYDINT